MVIFMGEKIWGRIHVSTQWGTPGQRPPDDIDQMQMEGGADI